MRGNGKARSGVATPEQAKMGAGSTTDDTTATRGRQTGKITDFLSYSQENAMPLRHLRELLHLPARTIRLMIRAERLHGVPICEDSKSGYYLPKTTGERDLCAKRLRHRAAQIVKVADAIEGVEV